MVGVAQEEKKKKKCIAGEGENETYLYLTNGEGHVNKKIILEECAEYPV